MKKIIIIFMIMFIISAGSVGFYFKDDIISVINNTFGDDDVIEQICNLESNESINPLLMGYKSDMDKKDYKNFLNMVNHTVTSYLNLVGERLPGYASLDNVLYVDDGTKSLNFINANMYNSSMDASYCMLIWKDGSVSNPSWPGEFIPDDAVLEQMFIDMTIAVADTQPETEQETVVADTIAKSNYDEIKVLYGEDVSPAEDIYKIMQETFKDKYNVVDKLISEAKLSIEGDTSVMTALSTENAISYGGKVKEGMFYVTVGKINDDKTLGKNNYVLFRIGTDGNYDNYANSIITMFNDETILPGVELTTSAVEEETMIETIEETKDTELVEISAAQEVVSETTAGTVKKSPVDLFDELMKESTANETITQQE